MVSVLSRDRKFSALLWMEDIHRSVEDVFGVIDSLPEVLLKRVRCWYWGSRG
jgi:hypothetical protein